MVILGYHGQFWAVLRQSNYKRVAPAVHLSVYPSIINHLVSEQAKSDLCCVYQLVITCLKDKCLSKVYLFFQICNNNRHLYLSITTKLIKLDSCG